MSNATMSEYEMHCADARAEADYYASEAELELAALAVNRDGLTAREWDASASTLIPPTYPALEAEVYASLDFATERETMVPACDEQLGLEADCFVGEVKS